MEEQEAVLMLNAAKTSEQVREDLLKMERAAREHAAVLRELIDRLESGA